MRDIYIAGNSGAGKSTLSKILLKILPNTCYIDCDEVSHRALELSKEKIASLFGTSVVKEGRIDRKELGSIVFNDKEKMYMLNQVIWDTIENIIEGEKEEGKILIVDGIRVHELKTWGLAFKVLIKADNEKRKEYAILRDNISEEEFNMRDKNSIDYTSFKFDYVINNDGNIEELEIKAKAMYRKYLEGGYNI